MQNITSIENKNNDTTSTEKLTFKRIFFSVLIIFFLIPWYSFAEENTTDKTLIVYYSRTGKTKLICETLQNHLNADLLAIKDLKDREGTWGYITAAFDVIFNRHTPIEPEKIDFSSYQSLVVASPIWNWKISTPIHTFLDDNKFDGKKVVLITNANIHIMKYEQYGDDASFVKKFLKDYLRGKKKAAQSVFMTSGGEYAGHYHIETKEKTDRDIIGQTLKLADSIKKTISPDEIDVTKRV